MEHWSSLRRGSDLPTSEAFLDHPSARFSPFVYILEVIEGTLIVRLQGTQLERAWARDLTGGDFFPGRSPYFKAGALDNVTSVLTRPCGHLLRSTHAPSEGESTTCDWIQLPLAVRDQRSPRIVGAVFQHGVRNFTEAVMKDFVLHKVDWLDVGYGVPNTPPVLPED